MGEMADMLLDQMWDEDEDCDPEHHGGGKHPNPRLKVCKFCGMEGLDWGKDKSGKWRLFEDHILHVCKYKNK